MSAPVTMLVRPSKMSWSSWVKTGPADRIERLQDAEAFVLVDQRRAEHGAGDEAGLRRRPTRSRRGSFCASSMRMNLRSWKTVPAMPLSHGMRKLVDRVLAAAGGIDDQFAAWRGRAGTWSRPRPASWCTSTSGCSRPGRRGWSGRRDARAACNSARYRSCIVESSTEASLARFDPGGKCAGGLTAAKQPESETCFPEVGDFQQVFLKVG